MRGGTFRRNPPDVGILASLDALRGPTFDPGRVHPLIREFYEHTSRFKLSIVPEWRRWMKPGYELFKRVVAEPLGQAAIPSNIEEAQRGMVSTIDTIAVDGGVDGIAQSGALNHAIDNDARDGRRRRRRADRGQGAQRRNLLRHRMFEAEALETPTQTLERRDGRGESPPTDFRAKCPAVGQTRR